MRYQLVLLALGAFLAITSCVRKTRQGPPVSTFTHDYEFMTLAGKEYRYDTKQQCDDAAAMYLSTNYPTNSPEVLTKVSDNPTTYSIKAKDEDIEVRFTVIAQENITEYGKLIYYYKVNKTSGHTEQEDIGLASDEFVKRLGHVNTKPPFQDKVVLEGKHPWRAILKRKRANLLHRPVGDEEEYGIVINPPYPR